MLIENLGKLIKKEDEKMLRCENCPYMRMEIDRNLCIKDIKDNKLYMISDLGQNCLFNLKEVRE